MRQGYLIGSGGDGLEEGIKSDPEHHPSHPIILFPKLLFQFLVLCTGKATWWPILVLEMAESREGSVPALTQMTFTQIFYIPNKTRYRPPNMCAHAKYDQLQRRLQEHRQEGVFELTRRKKDDRQMNLLSFGC